MAHLVEITDIFKGDRYAVFHVHLKSDGVSAELSDEVIIDPVEDFGLGSDTRFAIEHITSSLTGFTAVIEFDTGLVTDKTPWLLTPDVGFSDFRHFSALKDKSGIDGTGKIQITTTDFSGSGEGTFVIKIRKP